MGYQAYESVSSDEALAALTEHYVEGAGIYKFWAAWKSVGHAVARGWQVPDHPAQLHYAWDAENERSLNEAIRKPVRLAIGWLNLDALKRPQIADTGCGVGGCVTQIASENPEYVVEGISIVQRQIEIAEKRKNHLGLDNVRFTQANLLRLPHRDKSFDGIIGIEAHCHIGEKEKPRLYGELYRVLKPNRRLVVLDGYKTREPEGEEVEWYDIFKRGFSLTEMITGQRQTELMKEAGFREVLVKDVTERIRESTK